MNHTASNVLANALAHTAPGFGGLAAGLATQSAAWAFAVAVACAIPTCATQARLALSDILIYRIETRPTVEENSAAARRYRKRIRKRDAPP